MSSHSKPARFDPHGVQKRPRTTHLALTCLDSTLSRGLALCSNDEVRPFVDYGLAQRRLGSRRSKASATVLRNATLVNGDGTVEDNMVIIFEDDIFICIARLGDGCRATPYGATVFDLAGRFVTPGLVDMHSHVGVRPVPELWASEDVSELKIGPMSPWARALDGLKPQDSGIPLLLSGGITTSLVLTGAKNLISGEGIVIKMKETQSPTDLPLDTRGMSRKPQRHLKMACGENIKATLGYTREGMSYEVRRAFSLAHALKRRQDDWCAMAASPQTRVSLDAGYPEDISLQTLVDVLRGDLRTHAHCYEPEDVWSLYDHADEFGFNITAMHHALEAHHVVDLIKSHNTMLATFSDEWGFKKEVYGASAYMLAQAAAAGIPIALTSDHPAKNGQFLAYEAQIAHHFGLDTGLALASITGVPAKALGIDNRVGYVVEGYDADLVIWDRHPLQLGARPLQVMVEGKTAVNASHKQWTKSLALTSKAVGAPPHRVQVSPTNTTCALGAGDVVVTGLRSEYITAEHRSSNGSSNLTLVARAGQIVCLGFRDCDQAASKARLDGVAEMHVEDGHLLPGLTMVTRNHGLAEILSEGSTSDGIANGEDFDAPRHTKYGLSFDGWHLDRAHRAGITRLVTPPRSSGMLHGVSTTFRPGAASRLETGAIAKDDTAIHFTIGHEAKSEKFPTISSQFEKLRYLLKGEHKSSSLYEDAAQGRLPVVVHTGNKDVISQVIQLKREQPQLNLVIMGGAEASHVAPHLADAAIPVIIAPWMCHPWSWDVRTCLLGPPLTDETPVSALVGAGVKVALGNWDPRDRYVRNAIWEASWAAGPDNASLAIDMVTRNVAEILGLPQSDDFVVYQRSPLEFGASVAIVFEQGRITRCWPDVE
ncbi:hypothetical protein GQ53DRAFT_799037 [Thozetella sp. PMI_491]|nr:hypothetical protein GQ53DRAFT_799037 [Thozetella sp. PMI_491]